MKDAQCDHAPKCTFRSSWEPGGDLITLTVRTRRWCHCSQRRHRTLPAFGPGRFQNSLIGCTTKLKVKHWGQNNLPLCMLNGTQLYDDPRFWQIGGGGGGGPPIPGKSGGCPGWGWGSGVPCPGHKAAWATSEVSTGLKLATLTRRNHNHH